MRILLIEDHEDLGEAIERRLRDAGHSVEWLRNGDDGIEMALREQFDVIALDLTLPGRDGISILGELRRSKSETPVLVMTARAEIDDKVSLLDRGADDYLVKPFDLRELEARLRVLMRRPAGQVTSVTTVGDLRIDLANGLVALGDRTIDLGRREFRLLEILVARVGQVVPKERLMAQLFNFDEDVSVNALELQVSRLRRKIEGSRLDIETVRGVGYLAKALK
ncbi:response regulator transcription factor [Mesorhizobium sp. CAU 1732]|uniref:response regulator transcription factor n=1 Tax=Mesorhizobium sp. CAU 1732 TaxID=3140358 RepID=UPI0032603837